MTSDKQGEHEQEDLKAPCSRVWATGWTVREGAGEGEMLWRPRSARGGRLNVTARPQPSGARL